MSGRRSHELVAVELAQVVGGGDQLPLAGAGLEAAPPEAADAAVLLDVAEDRLDHPAALFIETPPAFGRQLAPHAFARRERGRDASSWGRAGGAPVTVAASGDQQFGPGLGRRPDVGVGIVAGVG